MSTTVNGIEIDEKTMANARVIVNARLLASVVKDLVKATPGTLNHDILNDAAAKCADTLLNALDARDEAFRFKG